MKTKLVVAIGALIAVSVAAWGWMKITSESPVPASGQAGVSALEEYYTCPMHPSVRSERPGACPVCEMTLVKKAARTELPDKKSVVKVTHYTCPMHDAVQSESPGRCPDCGMALVQAVREEREGDDMSGIREVALSPMQRLVANVATEKVRRRQLLHEIQASGIVSYAEPAYSVISMRFPGRVEKLFITYAGQKVHKGDPVAVVYSPEVILEEQAYLRALDAYRQSTRNGGEISDPTSNFLRLTKEKLVQLGFTDKQIDDLGKSETLGSYVTIYSQVSGTVVKKNVDPGRYYGEAGTPLFEVADLSTVWILLDVYEQEIRFVKQGQYVEITTEAYPLERFKARVTFLDPIISPESRTIRVRTESANPGGKLRPNLYVNGTIKVPAEDALVVPSTAILPVGKRSVVWVEEKENLFRPREVAVGASGEGYTVVLAGLKEAETVASSGGFLIDSESGLSWTGDNDSQN